MEIHSRWDEKWKKQKWKKQKREGETRKLKLLETCIHSASADSVELDHFPSHVCENIFITVNVHLKDNNKSHDNPELRLIYMRQ